MGMLKPPRYLKTLVAGVLLNYFRSVFFKWGNRGQERLEDLRQSPGYGKMYRRGLDDGSGRKVHVL